MLIEKSQGENETQPKTQNHYLHPTSKNDFSGHKIKKYKSIQQKIITKKFVCKQVMYYFCNEKDLYWLCLLFPSLANLLIVNNMTK